MEKITAISLIVEVRITTVVVIEIDFIAYAMEIVDVDHGYEG